MVDIKINRTREFKDRTGKFPNKISTTKYTIWNILPKNLYEQLTTRWANILFLLIAVLNYLPWAETLTPSVQLLPIVFILTLTLIKDAVEDYFRYRSDQEINSLEIRRWNFEQENKNDGSVGGYEISRWDEVVPGDVIMVMLNERVPVDCLIIGTSDDNGICYLQTSNLDGESNLKQYQAVSFNDPVNTVCAIQTSMPNPEITSITGKMSSNSQVAEFRETNCLLRGCTLRNTDYACVLRHANETRKCVDDI